MPPLFLYLVSEISRRLWRTETFENRPECDAVKSLTANWRILKTPLGKQQRVTSPNGHVCQKRVTHATHRAL